MILKEDEYNTIAKFSEGLFKDRGSKFIAFAYPVTAETQIQELIKEIRKKYYDARHHCYAYRLGADKKRFRANDDGEPSSTAGKPILGQLQSKDLTDVLIVVVRYFGGTLLGVGGLINAYRNAAADALNNAKIITKTVNDLIEITFDYSDMNKVMKIIKDEKLKMINQNFEMSCLITLNIRQINTDRISGRFKKIGSLKLKIKS